MNIIQIKILNYEILLPLSEKETVASISQAALQEYYKLNLKQPPKKVLYTCDQKGRVLSGNLPLPLPFLKAQNSEDEILEVKIEDYSDKDAIPIPTILPLYRQWQHYTLTQIKEYLQFISYRETPLLPEEKILQLIKELSKVNNNSLQLTCIALYKLLLTKFPQITIIHHAVEQLCRMFLSTNQRQIGLEILKIFNELSPLQMKLFESVKYMKLMLDVEHHLLRFHKSNQRKGDDTEDDREGEGKDDKEEEEESNSNYKNRKEKREKEMKEMFLLFESIISLLQDDELNQIYHQTKHSYDQTLTVTDVRSSQKMMSEEKKIMKELLQEGFDEEVAIYKQKFHPNSSVPAISSTSATTTTAALLQGSDGDSSADNAGPMSKKWNLSRLQALISSDDPKIRAFSLENLKKLLQVTYEASLIDDDTSPSKDNIIPITEENQHQEDEQKEGSVTSHSSSKKNSEAVLQPPELGEVKSMSTLTSNKSSHAALPTKVSSLSTLTTDGAVVVSPVSPNTTSAAPLNPHNNNNNNTNNGHKIIRFTDEQQYMGLVKTLMQALQKAIKGRNQEKIQRKQGNAIAEQLSQLSTAGRLAYIALKSPDTDLSSVQLIFDCLVLLFYFPLQYIQSYSAVSGGDNKGKKSHMKRPFAHRMMIPKEFEALMPSTIIQSIQRQQQHQRGRSSSEVYYNFNPLTGDYLTLIQVWFLSGMKEFYRLLFTLSHCLEYYNFFSDYYHLHPNYDLFTTLTERSAFFFSLILFYSSSNASTSSMIAGDGMIGVLPSPPPNGWRYCQLPLEKITLKNYLLSDSPNYRVFMALTYLIYIIKKSIQHQNTNNSNDPISHNPSNTLPNKTLLQKKTMMIHLETLQDLHDYFQYDSYSMITSIWAWCINKKSNLFLRRLSLQIISKLLIINDISYYLWKLDPIPRLLELLTKSYRMKNDVIDVKDPTYDVLKRKEDEKRFSKQQKRQQKQGMGSRASLTSAISGKNSQHGGKNVILACRHASLLQSDDCYYLPYRSPSSNQTSSPVRDDAVEADDEYDDENADRNSELISDNESVSSDVSHDTIPSATSSVDFDDFDIDDDEDDIGDDFSRGYHQHPPQPPSTSSLPQQQRKPIHVSIEWKLVKLILKSIMNLLQATISREYFTAINRIQLLEYLQNLKIGRDPSSLKGRKQRSHRRRREYYLLSELIHQKQEVYFYYQMIVENCEIAKAEIESTQPEQVP